jgi:uncharacterized protein (DUF305 family)
VACRTVVDSTVCVANLRELRLSARITTLTYGHDGRFLMQRFIKRRLGAVILLGLLSPLAACGGSDSSSGLSSATDEHNKADVAFATNMIPHHAQGVQMAEMVIAIDSNNKMATLAGEIQDAQRSQIETMTGWLKAWGEPAPMDMGGGMGHGGMSMPGMTGLMTPQQMQRLTTTSSTKFDELWLQMMVKHHQGAIDMANTELRNGQNSDAKALAQQIIDSQQAQITTMNRWLRHHIK